MRIVSICPSNTELLHFLGVENELVGIDNYSDWPEKWHSLPKVGPDLDIDIEKVKALHPDLVVASLSVPGLEKNIERLKQENLPFLVLNPKSLAEIAQDLIQLGEAIGRKKRGEQVAQAFLDQLHKIKQAIPASLEPVRLYFEWWPKPVFTPGRKSWLTEVSSIVGGINIFHDHDVETVQSDWNEVKKRKPDYVFIIWTGVETNRIKKELITSRPEWKNASFNHPNRIFILPEGWYCRPSPRILTGIQKLAHILYPDRFTPPDPEQPFIPNQRL